MFSLFLFLFKLVLKKWNAAESCRKLSYAEAALMRVGLRMKNKQTFVFHD
jgi:hypothetical protein